MPRHFKKMQVSLYLQMWTLSLKQKVSHCVPCACHNKVLLAGILGKVKVYKMIDKRRTTRQWRARRDFNHLWSASRHQTTCLAFIDNQDAGCQMFTITFKCYIRSFSSSGTELKPFFLLSLFFSRPLPLSSDEEAD